MFIHQRQFQRFQYGDFENLTLLLDRIGKNSSNGRLKGYVGSKANDKVIGWYGANVVNDKWARFLEICEQYQLKILNGFFKHKNIYKYT